MKQEIRSRIFSSFILLPSYFLFILITAPALSWSWGRKGLLSRQYESFELGAQYSQSLQRWAAFSCNEDGRPRRGAPTWAPDDGGHPSAIECTLRGYPQRDDFLVLEFYQGALVSIAHFQTGKSRPSAGFDEALKDVQTRLGKPTTPEYRSDRAVTYIWNDKKTYITLTHMIELNYTVYQVRDIVNEPLYRKASGFH